MSEDILLGPSQEHELHDLVLAKVLDFKSVDIVVLEFSENGTVADCLHPLKITSFNEWEYTVSQSSNLFSDRARSSFSFFSNSLFSSSSFFQIWSYENKNMLFLRMLICFLLSDCTFGSSLL